MELIPIEQEEQKELLRAQHFLQGSFWAAFKAEHGWKPLRFRCKQPEYFECSVLLRSFSVPLIGKVSLAYVPMGADFPLNRSRMADISGYAAVLSDFSVSIKQFLPENTLCIRYDIPVDCFSLEECSEYTKSLLSMGKLRKAPDNVQPPDTVLLDLTRTEEQLLDGMKGKWRYNIRLAQKKGVSVRKGSADDIDVFYELYQATAARDGIAIHSKDYYRDLLSRGAFSESADGGKASVSLYIASHEEQALAAIITIFTAEEAVYLYGASSNEKRNLMPAYLLQWRAICDAKAAGCSVYDFYGIPPTDDERHPMHGLYRFKTGFGGTIIHRPGSIDFQLSAMYRPYIMAERLRNFWYKKIKKLLAGR